MLTAKIRNLLISIVTVCIIVGASIAVIAYGRGYRLDVTKKSLSSTGLMVATSDPTGAQIIVDGKVKSATNTTVNLRPGWYTVQIRKEGYIPWEKKLRVQGEVVTRADAYLFPTNPSLSPITTSGILTPTLSPEGNTIAFFITAEATRDGIKKPGLWTLELADRPLGGRNRDPKLVVELPAAFPYKDATILWSPDGRSIIVSARTSNTLYELGTNPVTQNALSQAMLTQTLTDWQKEKEEKDRQKLSSFKQPFVDMATTSARLITFSPDETKILYEATAAATIPAIIDPPLIGANPIEESRTIKPGSLYVYDSKEDKNFFVLDKKELPSMNATPTPSARKTSPQSPLFPLFPLSSPLRGVQWFPTNRHLLLTLPGKIDIMEYDRTNWATVYSGPFEGSFLTPWPGGSRIVILTNLNPGTGSLPNLYTVNLR